MRPALFSALCWCVTSLVLSSLLTGCTMTTGDFTQQDVSSAAMSGKIMGGQQPVKGATVTVYSMGTTGYGTGATSLASTTTDDYGNFQFAANAYTCPPDAPVYILASDGDPGGGQDNPNMVLAAVVGTCQNAHHATVNVNEVTTAVAAFALSHFFTPDYGGNADNDQFGGPSAGPGVYSRGIVNAMFTNAALLSLPTGTVATNTSTMTIEAAKIYSIANSLAACVNTSGMKNAADTNSPCGRLMSYATPSGQQPTKDTLQAAVRMALHPYVHVSDIYNLATAGSPFVGLPSAPNDWTIGVAYHSSAFELQLFAVQGYFTSSTIDIDADGKVWFPTTAIAANGVGYFDPRDQSFNGPFLTSLFHPQYVAITTQGNVYANDFLAKQIGSTSVTSPTAAGTIIETGAFTGSIIAGYSGTVPDTIFFTVNDSPAEPGVSVDTWNGTVQSPLLKFNAPPNGLLNQNQSKTGLDAGTSGIDGPCSDETSAEGDAPRVLTRTSPTPCYVGGVANMTGQNEELVTASVGELCSPRFCFAPEVPLDVPTGVELDGGQQIWIANAGNGSISTLAYTFNANNPREDFTDTSPVAYLHGADNGNTMSAPYGLAIDNSGNVWVSNANCFSASGFCAKQGFTLSELIGAAYPTLTPIAVQTINYGEGTLPTK